MPHVLVRHKIENWSKWKPVFDDDAQARGRAGSAGGTVFRNANDPNEVFVLLEWSDLDAARRFVESADLREKMQEAGVTDRPDVYFIEAVDTPPV